MDHRPFFPLVSAGSREDDENQGKGMKFWDYVGVNLPIIPGMTSHSRTDISTYKNKQLHSERAGLHKASRTYCVTRFIGPQSKIEK